MDQKNRLPRRVRVVGEDGLIANRLLYQPGYWHTDLGEEFIGSHLAPQRAAQFGGMHDEGIRVLGEDAPLVGPLNGIEIVKRPFGIDQYGDRARSLVSASTKSSAFS